MNKIKIPEDYSPAQASFVMAKALRETTLIQIREESSEAYRNAGIDLSNGKRLSSKDLDTIDKINKDLEYKYCLDEINKTYNEAKKVLYEWAKGLLSAIKDHPEYNNVIELFSRNLSPQHEDHLIKLTMKLRVKEGVS